jgi:uracil-DNA glycosylase family 4
VPCDGRASSGVLLVGDAPRETEARIGKPFVGAEGFYLDRVLKRGGLNRATFALHNVLSCRPPNNWLAGASYEQAAISHCSPYLDRTIRDQNPRVLVAFGNTALRRLVPEADGIARHRGFVLQAPDGRFVIPTFHPNFLLPRIGQDNTSRFIGVVIRDIRRATQIARDGFKRLPQNYLLDPKPDQFAAWITEFERWARTAAWPLLAFDIETPYKLKNQNEDDITDEKGDTADEPEDSENIPIGEPILRISFSYRAGEAVTVPWRGDYLAGIRALAKTDVPKAVWNGVRFDVPVIESHGFRVGGRIYDFMWGFHVWQSDLPKGLEFAASLLTDLTPWKHLSDAQPAHYNAQDSDAQLRNGLALRDEMTATGQWDIFERHIVTLDKLLMEMGAHGVLIDKDAQDGLRHELEGERDKYMRLAQQSVPEALKPRTEYKRLPDGSQFIPEGGYYQFERRVLIPRLDQRRCQAMHTLPPDRQQQDGALQGRQEEPLQSRGRNDREDARQHHRLRRDRRLQPEQRPAPYCVCPSLQTRGPAQSPNEAGTT